MTTTTALSGYDYHYKTLTEAEREDIQVKINAIMAEAGKVAHDKLIEGVQKAVTATYEEVLANPWKALLDKNADSYCFVSAIRDHLIERLKLANPDDGSWTVKDLIAAWREHHPAEFDSVVNKELAEENKRLREQLDFQVRCNRSEF